MKRFLLLGWTALGLLVAGCANPAGLEDRIGSLEDRVTALEQLCQELNANVATLQAFAKARENSLTVTAVEKLSDGFAITFSTGERYVLKNGVSLFIPCGQLHDSFYHFVHLHFDILRNGDL